MSQANYHNPNLYQWKRFSKPKIQEKRSDVGVTKHHEIRGWLEKVEDATDEAVRKTFEGDLPVAKHNEKMRYPSHHGNKILQTVSQLHDDEDAHSEAQELVTNWMNEKIRFDFLEDEEISHGGSIHEELRDDSRYVSGVESATHEKWYEDSETFIQRYLDADNKKSSTKPHQRHQACEKDVLGQIDIYEADESTIVEALMKNMLEKPLIKPSTMKALKKRDNDSDRRHTISRDPKTTMNMRHREVKDARIRRQKEDEKRRQERMTQKEVKFKAKQILKEEEMQKKLREKQEEEAIQAEMAKLRKEMIEQRKREEKTCKEKEYENAQFIDEQERLKKRQGMERAEREKQKENIMNEISRLEEKEQKVAEVLKKRNFDNRKLVRNCFSNWCKVVLAQRVKLGKAKAMADWKCMQKVWSGWKFYTRNQKLDVETRHHQASVRETRLKEKKAINCEKFKLLRKCLLTWKVHVNTEQERKEILKQQQNTKAKMQALLDAVASGNIGNNIEDQNVILQSIDSNDATDVIQLLKQNKSKIIPKSKIVQDSKRSKPPVPRHAWQVTRKDVYRLKSEEMENLSSQNHTPKMIRQINPVPMQDPFENRHKFQKDVIDQQRLILQEQKRMIEEMQEQHRIHALQQQVTVLQQQKKNLENPDDQTLSSNRLPTIETMTSPDRSEVDVQQPHSARSGSSIATATKKHPIVSKMEERAAERMKRRKGLDEMKRKREEERIKILREEEEQKQREEQEQKRKEIDTRREAKRQQKKLEEEKKIDQERMRELCKMADNHYMTSLLKNHGLHPWKKLMQSMKNKQEVADYHHNSVILRKSILAWNFESEKARNERDHNADELYRKILLRRGIRSWKKYGERMEILEQKAIIHRNKILRKQYLKHWVDYTTDEKLSEWDKESRADNHNRTRQLRRVFNIIRSYRDRIIREAERHKRLGEMRRKVTQLLPDFKYSNDSFSSDVVDGDNDKEII